LHLKKSNQTGVKKSREGSGSVAYKDLAAMVMDDFSTMRRIVRKILKDLRFEKVIEAENGVEVLRLLESNKIDLIVLDWNMPMMTGSGLLKRVRADERLKGLPFLMVTAEAQKENIIEAIQAKVSNYVIKPFSPAAFEERLAKIIPQGQ
jgi:two-component system chemotaxis response regulator CheY